uniref:Secreted protein n=1 Tax=Angiostrongylus cantonensis TaxID=6313 RepID=A0A0K0DRH3_ANGCA
MTGVANIANVPAIPLLLSLLTITAVFGCAAGPVMVMDNKPACVIIGNTVTAICNMACRINMPANLMGIPASATTISGTLTTTNPIMANWSTEMWQGVVNRVIRALQLGPLGTNFFSASATVQ